MAIAAVVRHTPADDTTTTSYEAAFDAEHFDDLYDAALGSASLFGLFSSQFQVIGPIEKNKDGNAVIKTSQLKAVSISPMK